MKAIFVKYAGNVLYENFEKGKIRVNKPNFVKLHKKITVSKVLCNERVFRKLKR